LEKELPRELLASFYALSEDADFAGPWHGLSAYGEVMRGVHYAAVDICTKEVAQNLLTRARRAYKALEDFYNYIRNSRPKNGRTRDD
jgi:hypothetical protein